MAPTPRHPDFHMSLGSRAGSANRAMPRGTVGWSRGNGLTLAGRDKTELSASCGSREPSMANNSQ